MPQLSLDSALNEIEFTTAGVSKKRSLVEFLETVSRKVPDLGLLPPVVRVITPLNDGAFTVLIERTPCKQQIVVEDFSYKTNVYNITLPWHSYYFTLFYNSKKNTISLESLYLFFHSSQITSDADFVNKSFFNMPYLPNVFEDGRICLEKQSYKITEDSTNFIELYYKVLELLWNTTFNYDCTPNQYFHLWDIHTTHDNLGGAGLNDSVDQVLNKASLFTFEQACEPSNLSPVYQGTLPWGYIEAVPEWLNDNLTLSDLFAVGGL